MWHATSHCNPAAALCRRQAAASVPPASGVPVAQSTQPIHVSRHSHPAHGALPLLQHLPFLAGRSYSAVNTRGHAARATRSSSEERPFIRRGSDDRRASKDAARSSDGSAAADAADATGASNGAGDIEKAVMKHLGIMLPQFCCGCGIRLQRTDPQGPGFFIIPAKLLEGSLPEGPQVLADGAAMAAAVELEGSAAAAAAEVGSDAEREYAAAQRRARQREELAIKEVTKDATGGDDLPAIICQRCHALKNYGKVKVESAESALPDFDLGRKVGRKIFLQKDRRAVVLLVVDVCDFDGSLPREALRALYPAETPTDDSKFKLMVAVNKFDLLPSHATPMRVGHWVRQRLKQAGLPQPDEVYMVSAVKGMGVREVVEGVKAGLGFRGDLWVVGAQNAGKSSLITAMKRLAGTAGKRDPTIAPMPGTTLNLLQVPGLPLGPKHRAFDTPGVPHDHQLTTHLGIEDVKAVLPSKQLRARTYRVGAGNTVMLGGLAMIDIIDAPAATIYLTVYVSHAIDLHMGKTEGAAEKRVSLCQRRLLMPPTTGDAFARLPQLTPRDCVVTGSDWKRATVDVAIAGLGWLSVGCVGDARLRVWTLPGVSVTTHSALIPDYAERFEKPGTSSLLPRSQQQQQQVADAADMQHTPTVRSSGGSSKGSAAERDDGGEGGSTSGRERSHGSSTGGAERGSRGRLSDAGSSRPSRDEEGASGRGRSTGPATGSRGRALGSRTGRLGRDGADGSREAPWKATAPARR